VNVTTDPIREKVREEMFLQSSQGCGHNPPDRERFGACCNTLISMPEELEAYLRPKKQE